MEAIDGLNINLYPAYIPEVLMSGAALPGVPDFRRLLAAGYEPGAYRIPDADSTAVVARGKFEARVSLPVSSYVWAFSGYSSQSAGFRVKITDIGTGGDFGARTFSKVLTGEGQTIAGGAYPLAPLDKPRLVIEPGLLTVQVENLASAVNEIYFVLWTAEPRRRVE